MTVKTRTSGQARAMGLVPRIVLAVIGLALVFMAITNFLLPLLGHSAVADVSARRVGGSTGNRNEISYQWSVSWTFNVDGTPYEGHAMRRGSPFGVDISSTVLYLPFAPWINNLADVSKLSLLNLLTLGLGVILLTVALRRTTNQHATRPHATPDTLSDYDDSVEEYFHQ